jgi:predicted nucleic acid-binding protein
MTYFRNIFVDTSAWVALADKGDIYHKKAAAAYPSLLKSHNNIITSNLIIAETYVLILNELGIKAALDFLVKIRTSPMKRNKIRKAFCFDKHYFTAGFEKVP